VPTIISHYKKITAYTTRDGSEIRELMHPQQQGNQQQSLAEAIVQPGQDTLLHLHQRSEELYFITQGKGHMQLGDEQLQVETGDCICIPANTPHRIENTGTKPLKILCCCSPAYAHDDTQLL
jgi:mannose-6-phosphate isomerase-like protein (cupin superfamily)